MREQRRGAKERKEGGERERVWHPKDGKPENGETIQSAADAANCPLIIRSRGDRSEEGLARPSLSISSNEGEVDEIFLSDPM